MSNLDSNILKVVKKFEFLQTLHASVTPTSVPARITQGLKSQLSFALLEDDEYQLSRLSLNTLKQVANLRIDGGFKRLENLRRAVYEHLTQEQKPALPRSDLKSELKITVSAQTNQIVALKEHNMHLSYMLRDILKRYKSLASTPPSAIKARYEIDKEEIEAMLHGMSMNIWD